MSSRMTICPNRVKYVPVSTTTSPVTQEALVAVNNALKNDKDEPSLLAIGSVNSNAPDSIMNTKPNGSTLIGLIP